MYKQYLYVQIIDVYFFYDFSLKIKSSSIKKQLQSLFQFKAPVKIGSVQTTNGNIVSGKGATGNPIISNFIKAPIIKNKRTGKQITTDNLA